MKKDETKAAKELYKQLRALPWSRLWEQEVKRFDAATDRERMETVSVIRAVGVVFSESGPQEQEQAVKQWLVALLQDPTEKVRRYAMAALPKIGAGVQEETELLALLRKTTEERERKFLGQTLDKIGGEATLKTLHEVGLAPQTEQKVKASVARSLAPSLVRMDAVLHDCDGLLIHLRGRRGLEQIVQAEVEEYIARHPKFRLEDVRSGVVAIRSLQPFSLADLYTLRCFGTLGLVLGTAARDATSVDALASLIASPLSQKILTTLTDGSIRYRLDFVGKGHQRSAVRLVANRAYALCPAILNDARTAPWAIDIHSTSKGDVVELRPRFSPDPRLAYRQGDVPAASHPPLAACMARLAGPQPNEKVWDPFCGSGLELVERALLGGVSNIYGSDLSEIAIAIAKQNLEASQTNFDEAHFVHCDFRDFANRQNLARNSLTLILTNPPMGMRVPIPNLRALIEDLFTAAAALLRPGGRLVFANPLRMECPNTALKLESRRTIDFGGFDCTLEKYLKSERRAFIRA